MDNDKKNIIAYAQLMRLDKPIGTFLLLWPTWWALWLSGNPTFYSFIILSLGVFIMRSAGCVINDFADRNVDGYVTRTKKRPFVTGQATERGAKLLFLLLISIAFVLVLTLSWLAILFSFLALLLAMLYPFMKRFTYFPQVFLGFAYSSAILIVYATTTNSFSLTCWLLCIANVCWTVAYDTEYAMVDRDDDLKIGIKSIAIFFGCYDRLIIGLLQIITLAIFIIIGLLNQLSIIFYLMLVLVTGLFIWQQKLIYKRNPTACFSAFLNNNYVGMAIWMAILGGIYC